MKPADEPMETAERSVAREAWRAGRERELATLLPYLHRDPADEELALLEVQLPWTGAAFARALASLRRRFRELAQEPAS